MNNDSSNVLNYLDKLYEKTKNTDYFIENAEFLLKDDSDGELYSYILKTFDNVSEIHIDKIKRFKNNNLEIKEIEDFIKIYIRVNGTLTQIGFINEDWFAIIGDKKINIKNKIRKLDNFGYGEEVVALFYVPSKGIYRLRTVRNDSYMVLTIHLLLSIFNEKILMRTMIIDNFNQNKSGSFEKNIINIKKSNEFKVYIDNYENFQHIIFNKPYGYIKFNNLIPLNCSTICSNLNLENEEQKLLENITKNTLTLRFKFCPVFQKVQNGWELNLVNQYYLIGYSANNLLSFVHSNREIFNCKLWNNFYRELECFFNNAYDINIEFNERTDIKELQNIIKALDY